MLPKCYVRRKNKRSKEEESIPKKLKENQTGELHDGASVAIAIATTIAIDGFAKGKTRWIQIAIARARERWRQSALAKARSRWSHGML